VDAVADALERQKDVALELVGGDIAVRDAQRDAARAAEELTDALAENEDGMRGAEEAIDAAARAQLDAASAATEYKIKQLEANGQSVDAGAKASIYKAELERLASQLDGPLAAAIQNYINQLNNIPTTVSTSLSLTRNGDTLQRSGNRASGGPVAAGGLYEVNENGSELLHEGGRTFLMAGANGVVEPLGGVSGGAMGGATFNLTVNAGAGANGQLIGQQIVNEIKKWERQNGAGWRQ
jgi:uncharacterized phage infection (PIP) family protein YhgE